MVDFRRAAVSSSVGVLGALGVVALLYGLSTAVDTASYQASLLRAFLALSFGFVYSSGMAAIYLGIFGVVLFLVLFPVLIAYDLTGFPHRTGHWGYLLIAIAIASLVFVVHQYGSLSILRNVRPWLSPLLILISFSLGSWHWRRSARLGMRDVPEHPE